MPPSQGGRRTRPRRQPATQTSVFFSATEARIKTAVLLGVGLQNGCPDLRSDGTSGGERHHGGGVPNPDERITSMIYNRLTTLAAAALLLGAVACGGDDATSPPPAPQTATIRLLNESSATIVAVYFTSCDESTWARTGWHREVPKTSSGNPKNGFPLLFSDLTPRTPARFRSFHVSAATVIRR